MKKLLIILLLIIAVVGGLAYYYLSSINAIVEEQIEKHGSNTLQTNVDVGGVNIQLMEGSGEISDFSIANPKGFSDNTALGFKKVRLDIETKNITKMPIVIEEILIDSVSTLYELNSTGKGNLNALLDQIKTQEKAPSKQEDNSSSQSDIRIVIQKLTIKDTQLVLDLTAIGQKKYDETLPSFTINNIGGTNGLPPEQLSEAVGKSLLNKIIKEAKEKQTEKLKGKVKEKVMEKLNEKGGEKLKGLMDSFGS